jgi:hypothetical protein
MTTKERELLGIAETLCDGYKDLPCGCEGCPLFDWDTEEFDFVLDCPLYQIKKELTNK